MNKIFKLAFLATALAMALAACVSSPKIADNSSAQQIAVTVGDPAKKAILVVSFGTSYNETREATIDAIESEIAAAYPDYPLRRAFTSQIIINKLASRDGLQIDNVIQAIERLISDNVGTLIVQPTHVMHGFEYEEMLQLIAPYSDNFAKISYCEPLLSSVDDYESVSAALIAEYAPLPDTALVLMGHGTEHFANSAYAALDYRFKDLGYKNVFVGTVESYPDINTIIKNVNDAGYSKVILAPLMVVAGDHASNDMAGDDDTSWKVLFQKEGKQVTVILKGLGEIKQVRDIYVDHVAMAINAE